MVLTILLLYIHYSFISACMMTVPTEETTVLPMSSTSGMDTSAAVSVTTTIKATLPEPANPCESCTASQIVFQKKTMEYDMDAMYIENIDEVTGCSRIVVICQVDKTGLIAFMQFNTVVGGPVAAGRAEAVLNCVNGQWIYSSVNVDLIITKVQCQQGV